jgi:hypothetical protein
MKLMAARAREAKNKGRGMFSPDEMHMNNRTIERDTACAEIGLALNRLSDERRNPDLWERVCLVRALGEVFSGCYGLAITDARLALIPPKERSPTAKLPIDPFIERCDLPLLMKAWRAAMVEPVRQFPHLGPIVVDGRASQ